MKREQINVMRRGIMCCIEANQTHHCPPDCPYHDGVINGTPTYCEGVLLLDAKAYIMQLEHVLRLAAERKPARLFTLEELECYCGAAWLEVWLEADPDEGDPEKKELHQVGVCSGNLVFQGGDTTGFDWVQKQYNKRFGLRLWTRQPSDAQREAEPWKG